MFQQQDDLLHKGSAEKLFSLTDPVHLSDERGILTMSLINEHKQMKKKFDKLHVKLSVSLSISVGLEVLVPHVTLRT